MNLAAPIALAWLGLAIPIVIFYILKIRLRQIPTSTTIFWQQIYDEKRPRTLWQQLRHLLSLLAQLLLLLLLVFALAEPFFNSEILQARRVILVVDNSASMNATDETATRLTLAKERGQKIISGLRFRDEMAIISVGAQPQVVCGLTGHERTLQDALTSVGPSDGPTQVEAGIALGRRLLGDEKRGTVIVLTDGCFKESEKLVDQSDVELQVVGTRVGNVGITNFQVRRSLLDPVGYEILTEVTNSSDNEVKCRLELDLNDAPIDVVPLTLTPGQSWSRSFEKTSTDGGVVVASIKHADALPIDNTARAILPKRETQRVVLITEGNLFLQKAIAANPLVDLRAVNKLPEKYEPGTLYVFHRIVPKQMPPVSSFVIDPQESTDLWKVGEKLANPIVTKQDKDSILMRHVRLDNVLMPEALKLEPTANTQVLVTALSGDPLYFSIEKDGHKTAVLTVNLDEGDLTFRTAFPIMITNGLNWFPGHSSELQESLAAGSITEISLPTNDSKQKSWHLLSPDGVKHALPTGVAKTSIGPIDLCGIWKVESNTTASSEKSNSDKSTKVAEGKDSKNIKEDNAKDEALAAKPSEPRTELACNLASRTESDLRVPEKLLKTEGRESVISSWLTRPIWFYLIVIALALTSVEWYLYQRRWIT